MSGRELDTPGPKWHLTPGPHVGFESAWYGWEADSSGPAEVLGEVRFEVAGADASFAQVFHVTGLAAFLAYGFVGVQESIWFGLPGKVALKHAADGLAYAAITGAAFGWLWP